MIRREKRAYTLIELLVSIAISSILIVCTASTYSLFKKSMSKDRQRVDINQSARVAMDRLSRELRQANVIITELPVDDQDLSVTQPNEIEFADGHSNDLTYRRYYISSSTLRLDVLEYYFSSDPIHRVRYNDIGTQGEAPIRRVIETQDIAENIQSLKLYRQKGIEVQLVTFDGMGQIFYLQTVVALKNI